MAALNQAKIINALEQAVTEYFCKSRRGTMRLTFYAALLLLIFFSGVAWAERLAVVDVDRIFRSPKLKCRGSTNLCR